VFPDITFPPDTSFPDLLDKLQRFFQSARKYWVLLPDVGAGSGTIGDHGYLTGLTDDDHLQYLTTARALTWHVALSGSHVTNGNSHDHAGGDGATVQALPVGVIVLTEDNVNPGTALGYGTWEAY
jgi:hypothetical protein